MTDYNNFAVRKITAGVRCPALHFGHFGTTIFEPPETFETLVVVLVQNRDDNFRFDDNFCCLKAPRKAPSFLWGLALSGSSPSDFTQVSLSDVTQASLSDFTQVSLSEFTQVTYPLGPARDWTRRFGAPDSCDI